MEDTVIENKMSASQLMCYMSCPRKWYYSYWEKLKPKVDRPYLTMGKLCHKGMEYAMRRKWWADRYGEEITLDQLEVAGINAMDSEFSEYIENVPLLGEEIVNQEILLRDAESIFHRALVEFDPMRYEVLTIDRDGEQIPALELHFDFPSTCTTGLHGYIDAILRDKKSEASNCVWCVDYKFRRTFTEDGDEAFNIQNTIYAYACMRMGIDITGTMTWQHLNTPNATPKLNIDGTMSRSKIKCTWEWYKDFLELYGLDPADYEEMEEKLSEIEWSRATYEIRNEETLQNIYNYVIGANCTEIWNLKSLIGHNPNIAVRKMYPWNCKLCQFKDLCQAELRGYDADYIKSTQFTLKEQRK